MELASRTRVFSTEPHVVKSTDRTTDRLQYLEIGDVHATPNQPPSSSSTVRVGSHAERHPERDRHDSSSGGHRVPIKEKLRATGHKRRLLGSVERKPINLGSTRVTANNTSGWALYDKRYAAVPQTSGDFATYPIAE